MAFEFLFANPAEEQGDSLQQGDILIRSELLKETLRQAHHYYAEAPDYTHFMVLTQSCDLVRRGTRRKTNAPYITLAAIRPFEALTERIFAKHAYPDVDFPIKLCDKAAEERARNALERLIHNTENAYFFIPKNSHPRIVSDLCVFLQLSVSLKVTHYDACLSSKIAQLSNIFQAKVGWLTGNVYSRVGTPDIEEEDPNPNLIKQQIYDEALYQHTAWLSPHQLADLKDRIKRWKVANNGRPLTKEDAQQLVSSVPTELEMLVNRAVDQLKQAKLLADSADAAQRVANLLKNDRIIKRIVTP